MYLAEWMAEGEKRFGPDPLEWAFMCPSCGDTSKMRDFAEPDRAGQECIGRQIPDGIKGCNWAAYGLIPGPVAVIRPDGRTVRVFEFAEANTAVVSE